MTTTITVPTVHRNGTSKRELLAGYKAAHAAVQRAIEAVRVSAKRQGLLRPR